MTWRDIGNDEVQHRAPYTTQLATAFRDNVIAAFRGAAGAVRQAVKASSGSKGLSSGGTYSTFEIGAYGGAVIEGTVLARESSNSVNAGFTVEFSGDAGSSYPESISASCSYNAVSTNYLLVLPFKVFVDFEAKTFVYAFGDKSGSGSLPDMPSGVNRVRVAGGAGFSVFLTQSGGAAES